MYGCRYRPSHSYFVALTHAIRNKLFCCTKPKKRTLCSNKTIFRRRWDADSEYVIFSGVFFFRMFRELEQNMKTKRCWEKKLLRSSRSRTITSWFCLCRFMATSCWTTWAHTQSHTFWAVSSFQRFLFIYLITIIFLFVILWLLLVYSFNTIYANEWSEHT